MQKVCLNCGQTFEGRANATFCSSTCKNAFHNAKRLGGGTTVYGVPSAEESEPVSGTQAAATPSAPVSPMGNLNLLGVGNLSAQMGKFEESISRQIGSVISRIGSMEAKMDNVTDEVENLKDATKDNTEVIEDLDAKTTEKFSHLANEVQTGISSNETRFLALSNQIDNVADKVENQSLAVPDEGSEDEYETDYEPQDSDSYDEDEDERPTPRRVSLSDDGDSEDTRSEASDNGGMGALGWMAVIGLGLLFVTGIGKNK